MVAVCGYCIFIGLCGWGTPGDSLTGLNSIRTRACHVKQPASLKLDQTTLYSGHRHDWNFPIHTTGSPRSGGTREAGSRSGAMARDAPTRDVVTGYQILERRPKMCQGALSRMLGGSPSRGLALRRHLIGAGIGRGSATEKAECRPFETGRAGRAVTACSNGEEDLWRRDR